MGCQKKTVSFSQAVFLRRGDAVKRKKRLGTTIDKLSILLIKLSLFKGRSLTLHYRVVIVSFALRSLTTLATFAYRLLCFRNAQQPNVLFLLLIIQSCFSDSLTHFIHFKFEIAHPILGFFFVFVVFDCNCRE